VALLALVAPWRERGADRSYDTSVASPALAQRRPRVLFDHAHDNAHSITGRFKPFAELLRADGCEVVSTSKAVTPALLAEGGGCDVLVIVNARPPEGREGKSALSDAEIEAITTWVAQGGSLLLAADHHPYGPAAENLAQPMGVRMVGGWCDDAANVFPGTADSGAIAYRRDKGMLGEHAILAGRSAAESINTIITFTGQSLVAPAEADSLLLCADSSVNRVPVSSTSQTMGDVTTTTFQTSDTSAAGHCQALAMTFGKGRVVMLGEAAMLSAQIDAKSNLKFGMNVPGADNRQFVLNTMRWLARGLE
jgi:hypothetical protein